jgi:hypothetical protein
MPYKVHYVNDKSWDAEAEEIFLIQRSDKKLMNRSFIQLRSDVQTFLRQSRYDEIDISVK